MQKTILSAALLMGCLSLHAQRVLTLEQCRDAAINHNIAVRSANRSLEKAQEQKKEAFTKYLPTVAAAGFTYHSSKDVVRGDINTSDVIPSSIASSIPEAIATMIPSSVPVGLMRNGTAAGITAVQPVFMGGQIVNGNKLAKVGVTAADLQRQLSEREVRLTTNQYYWNVVTLQEKLHTLQQTQQMLRSLEKDVNTAVKAGVALRNDLLQVQLQENQVEAALLEVNNGMKASRQVLGQYIGLSDSAFVVSGLEAKDSTFVLPVAMRRDPSVAAANMTESRLLEQNVQGTVLNRKLEVGKNLPSVAVGAGYDYVRLVHKDNTFGMVFATVSIPISSWWGGSHAIKRRKIEEQEVREQLADKQQLLSIKVEKEWDDVTVAYRKTLIAWKSIEQSRENLRLNQQFYHAGTGKMTDLLEAQRQVQQSRDSWVEAVAAYQLRLAEYEEMTK
jgi:outer membrane protein